MGYDPTKHHRRSIRLDQYDYRSEGAYFITIVTYQRQLLFGSVVGEDVELSTLGCIAENCWRVLPSHFDHVILDDYIIMPNHIHGIIFFQYDSCVRAQHAAPLRHKSTGITPNNVMPKSLGAVTRSYKSAVTRAINKTMGTPTTKRWQRNYYERVIRNEQELNALRLYIQHNPASWIDDDLYVATEVI